MSDALRKLIEQQEAIERLTEPLRKITAAAKSMTSSYDLAGQAGSAAEALRHFEASAGYCKLSSSFEGWSATDKLMREAQQHLHLIGDSTNQAHRLAALGQESAVGRSLTAMSAGNEPYEKMFQLPAIADINRLATEAIGSYKLNDDTLNVSGQLRDVEAAMRSMTSPWLNTDHELRSTRAFGDLISIGRAVTTLAPFEAALVENLRPGLGDWRDPISARDMWKDAIPRLDFYLERGFDSALTEFTPEAFAETVEVAGLAFALPAPDDDDDADGLRRSREAFARLQDLERAVRRFIVRSMERTFGADWMKHQLPPEMLDNWIAKRDKAVKEGQAAEPLINYADFTEYKAIIERKGNWSNVFKPVFGRPEDIRESFQRLFPLRIATMHARIITADDDLLLMSEVRRILRAIKEQS